MRCLGVRSSVCKAASPLRGNCVTVYVTGWCRQPRLLCRTQTRSCKAAATAGDGNYHSGHGGGGDGSQRNRGSSDGQGPGKQRSQRSFLQQLATFLAGCTALGLWQPWTLLQRTELIDTSKQSVAVIIPVLNEAGGILTTLQQLQLLQPRVTEIIVVDGGSTDNTVKLVKNSRLATKVLSAGRGRAVQMNAGAAAAKSELLCFLHADTTPPQDLVSVMRRELADPRTVLAGFVPSIEAPTGRRLWLLSFNNFAKTYYGPLLFKPLSYLRGLRALFGDQTLFCRAHDFKAVGGFEPQLSIMEDADLCIRMHMAGPTTCHKPMTGNSSHGSHCSSGPSSSRGGSRGSSSCDKATTGLEVTQQHTATADAAGTGGWLPWTPATVFVGAAAAAAGHSWQQWCQPRGRTKQVLDRVSVTSGRRFTAWGAAKATYIHVVISIAWYFGQDAQHLQHLYNSMYTDVFR